MSWDAYLYPEYGESLGEWNYTHNCNGMANAVIDVVGWDTDTPVFTEVMTNERSWWKQLNGMDGPTSAKFLGTIIRGLEADPVRFRAIQPDNGWGSYDSFLEVRKEMRDRIPEAPVKWQVYG